ncbi:MAG: SpoIIE family protein phosphatase [Coriobacteriia bacterium]
MTSLAERTRLSQALNDIDMKIHSRLCVDEILQAALDGFIAALGADVGDIKLKEDNGWVVRYQEGFGADVVGTRLMPEEAPVAERVASTRGPVTVEDYTSEPAESFVGFPAMHSLRATMALPLIIKGEVIGALFAWMRTEPRSFSTGELDFARRMAASVALALENQRLFTSEQEARSRAETAEDRLSQELERTAILLRASDELTSTTDPDKLLERLADVVLEATGIDRVFINLIDCHRRVLIPKIATGGLAAPVGTSIPFEKLSQTSLDAIDAQQTTILDYDRPNVPEADTRIAAANHARLVLFVPLVYKDDIIGHISLDQPGQRCEFAPEHIRIVSSIASQAAVAIHNAILYEREHTIAETLQQAVLRMPESSPWLDIAYRYQPASASASVGGDFYELFEIENGRYAIMIGDVAGKGIGAARLTGLIRDGARAYLIEGHDCAGVLERVNALTYRFTSDHQFATVFLGILDVATGELEYSSAGHPAPVITGPGAPRQLESRGGLLGAFPHTQFPVSHTVLAGGETMCLYTDGISEARSGKELFGEDRIGDALDALKTRSLKDIADTLLSRVTEYSGGSLRDDVVLLLVARKPVPES